MCMYIVAENNIMQKFACKTTSTWSLSSMCMHAPAAVWWCDL